MSLTPHITSQRGNLVVNKPAFNNMADLSNILRNINFDQNYFTTRRFANGLSVSVKGGGGGSDFEHHFKLESNGASNALDNILIRGGYWIHNGQSYPSVTINGTYNNDYENDVYNVTVSNAASKFIIADLDRGAGAVTFYTNDSATTSYHEITIGYVNSASETINQFIVGDIIDNGENDHSWHCQLTSNTSAEITEGYVYLGGAKYVLQDWDNEIKDPVEDIYYWIRLDRDVPEFVWESDVASAGYPVATDKDEIFPVLEVTVNPVSLVITDVVERLQSDIHVTLFG